MKSQPFLVRQQYLQAVPEFSRTLASAIAEVAAFHPEKARTARAAFFGQCTNCGIRVSGDELLAAAEMEPSSSPKVRRLQLGYCARNRCDSRYYFINFEWHSAIDWGHLLSQTRTVERRQPSTAAVLLARIDWREWLAERQPQLQRIALVVGVLALLFLARHWYCGGTIPYLREPEKFKVGVVSATNQFSIPDEREEMNQ